MTETEPRRDRFETVLLLVVYVLPLGATVVLLVLVGLPGLGLALLAVEAGVSAAVVHAKRPQERSGPGRAVLALCALAAVSAVGAAVLLSRV